MLTTSLLGIKLVWTPLNLCRCSSLCLSFSLSRFLAKNAIMLCQEIWVNGRSGRKNQRERQIFCSL